MGSRESGRAGFGVVGVGTWGHKHARVYASHPGAELVAVCDVQRERAERIAAEFGVRKTTTDFRELIEDPAIDAVSIVTPDFAHLGPVECAVRAGKHVLVEKPMATTVAEAGRLADLVRESGIKFMVDFHNRWNPAFYSAKTAIDSGEIGGPVCAIMKLHDKITVPTDMLSWAGRSSILWFLGSHGADLLRWMLGSEAETVYSVSRSGVLTRRGIDTPDVFHTVLRFANGAIATMETGWILPESEPVIVDVKCDIVCTDGAIKIDHSHNRTIQKYTRERLEFPNMLGDVIVHGREYGLTLESIRHFVECVVNDRTPLVGVHDGFVNTAILAAAEKSALEGVPVRVCDVM